MNSLPSWIQSRSSGVLLHLTSLPGKYGVGNIGFYSRQFIDFLKDSGFLFWQTCPLGPTGYGDSPYQVFSSFAGNPYLIDWDPLLELNLIEENDLVPLLSEPGSIIDYGNLYNHFFVIAAKAYTNFKNSKKICEDRYGSFLQFVDKNESWIYPYCSYQTLKQDFDDLPWWEWKQEFRQYNTDLVSSFSESQMGVFNLHAFLQYIFYSQWSELRSYANQKNIKIVGDLPIYVAPDSADTWQNPSLFEINPESGQFSHVAGVPPDYFNEDGQYWGNPLYDWIEHKKDGYDWWKQRLHAQLVLFDIVRIDHFRGFHDFWSIPVETQNAKLGEWKLGPGKEFWDAIKIEFPTLPFLAEDLGLITDEVRALRVSAGLPGMAVLQFAFDGDPENLYLPHNLTPDLVLYTGTHDNDTTCGWYHSSDEETQGNFRTYFNIPGEQPSWDMLRMAYRTTAQLVVIPVQDLLSLGSDARLNEPGHPFGNWVWRLSPWQLDQLIDNCSKYLKDQAKLSGRLPNKVVARSENYL